HAGRGRGRASCAVAARRCLRPGMHLVPGDASGPGTPSRGPAYGLRGPAARLRAGVARRRPWPHPAVVEPRRPRPGPPSTPSRTLRRRMTASGRRAGEDLLTEPTHLRLRTAGLDEVGAIEALDLRHGGTLHARTREQ